MIYYLIELQMGFYPVAVVLYNKKQHKITHHAQTKHSTQSYTKTIKGTLHTINATQILSQIRDPPPPNLEGQVPVFITPGNGLRSCPLPPGPARLR
jgi:hypothetical protein